MKLILIYKRILFLLALGSLMISCVEEIPIQSEGSEKAMVIEGTVTNELKQHQIKLSQVFALDTTGLNPLSGATVRVSGNAEYAFKETEPGIYTSTDSFAAQPGIDYELYVLANGEEYKSKSLQLPGSNNIGNLKANRVDYQGENGVVISLNSQISSQDVNYYKYEFIETFKFNSNLNKKKDLILKNGVPIDVFKTKEEFTCYRTENSKEIILANTNSLSENSVNDLLITFINSKDPKLSLRYSILVRQYVISRAAYSYYEILKELSGSDNIFSQSQPGFFAGNIFNVNDSQEKVIGFFDIASVSTKRTYFNYDDFYAPQDIRPKLVPLWACEPSRPAVDLLIEGIKNNTIRWFQTPLPPLNPVIPYIVVVRRCVDCTVFGTNEKPEFWED